MNNLSFLSWDLLGCWLITYGIHSTIWLGGLAILLRFTRVESFAIRELCWRVAMPLGIVTAMFGLGIDCGPRINLADIRLRAAPVETSRTPVATNFVQPPTADLKAPALAPRPTANLPTTSSNRQATGATLASNHKAMAMANAKANSTIEPVALDPAVDETVAPGGGVIALTATFSVVQLGCLIWLCACAWLFMRWTISCWRLHRCLKHGQHLELLDELMRQLAERVQKCSHPRVVLIDVAQPFTVGWLRPTIVVPQRALSELSREQLLALLAHELGHVQCGHAFWVNVLNLVCRVGCVQPLNFWAHRCWRREAECMADRWATRHCVRPQALASCLVDVASWQIAPRETPVLQFIGRRREALIERVELLIGKSRNPNKPAVTLTARASWAMAGAALLLALVGPKFSYASPDIEQDAGRSSQAQATWSTVQQEWQALRNDIEELGLVAHGNKSADSRRQVAVLLEKMNQIDRHYQEVHQLIEQEVGR